jgi:hypothetical protein
MPLDKARTQSQSLVSSGQTSLNICTNNEHLIINLAAAVGRRMVKSQQRQALPVVR